MTLLDLLTYVEQRPQMYLQQKTLECLESFIGGYYLCLRLNKILLPSDEVFKKEFHQWLMTHYADLDHDNSWLGIITSLASRQQQDEFELFFKLLAEFKAHHHLT